MMDGRVKTLHPMVHGGLLAVRDDAEHVASMADHAIGAIDLVVVNLYPVRSRPWRRAAPARRDHREYRYRRSLRWSARPRRTTPMSRSSPIRRIMRGHRDGGRDRRSTSANGSPPRPLPPPPLMTPHDRELVRACRSGPAFPETLPSPDQAGDVRYGENPHQIRRALRAVGPAPAHGHRQAEQLQGKELSYNNYNDADAALELVSNSAMARRPSSSSSMPIPAASPAAIHWQAYIEAAFACDTVSAFGGIIAVNRRSTARDRARRSPASSPKSSSPPMRTMPAPAVFARKKNLRLLLTGASAGSGPQRLRRSSRSRAAWLVQSRDFGRRHGGRSEGRDEARADRRRTGRLPLRLDGRQARQVERDRLCQGRLDGRHRCRPDEPPRSARIAAWKAKDAADKAGWGEPRTIGSAVASDAFFPFADGLLAAVEAGATAVIQPGGSIRDDDVIEAADEAGLAMVFTGMRHFRH
jgi:phosphoribosylaminoimidazolecarboxamide formyltransferase/IMP cyclohydrolase